MDLRLRISAGTSLDSMVSVDSAVNTGMPHKLTSDVFEGWIMAKKKLLTESETALHFFTTHLFSSSFQQTLSSERDLSETRIHTEI